MMRNRRYRRSIGPRRRIFSPWRSWIGVLWLGGILFLLFSGKIWPGILILVLFSLLLQGGYMLFAPRSEPDAFEQPEHYQPPHQPTTPPVQAVQTPAQAAPQPPQHRLELLPEACPKCGAPIRSGEVKWTGAQSADCPYCGANLPMNRLA